MGQALNQVSCEPVAFVIETGIPLFHNPRTGAGRPEGPAAKAIVALAKAAVGSSVFIPLGAFGGETRSDSKRHQLRCVGMANRKAGKGWAKARQVDGGCRVWKVAEPKSAA